MRRSPPEPIIAAAARHLGVDARRTDGPGQIRRVRQKAERRRARQRVG